MAHQVRAHQQDLARTDVLENLTEGQGLIVQDWAMNFLPRKFKEGQVDFFGKRGWPWSITVLYARINNALKSHVFVHIFGQVEKSATTALAIMRHVCETISKECKEIREVKYRSDNGNGYHAIKLINSIPCVMKGLPIKITDYDFSAPQDGKGIADAKGAIFKTHASRYVDEGENIATPSDLKKALDSYNGISGSSTYVCELQYGKSKNVSKGKKCIQTGKSSGSSKTTIDPSKWSGPGITSLNNFQFSKNSAKVAKAYKIGKGKDVKLNVPTKLEATLKILQGSKFRLSTPRSKYGAGKSNDDTAGVTDGLFTCDICNVKFDSYIDLIDHCSLGKHKGSLSSRDKAKLLYADKLETGFKKVPLKRSSGKRKSVSVTKFNKGWALKRQEPHTEYTDDMRAFLLEKFLPGERNKDDRANAADVAIEMRKVMKRGKRRFKKKNFLTSKQIKAYFSKLVKERKKD